MFDIDWWKPVIAVIAIIIVVVVVLGLTLGWFGVFYTKTIGVEQASAERQVFKENKSYIEGMASDLAKYKYELATEKDAVARKAIISLVVDKYGNFDIDKLENTDLRKFLQDVRNGKYEEERQYFEGGRFMPEQQEMKKYIGVKIIYAEPMNLEDYNKFKGWTIPENEDPNKEGYKVVYSDEYISWSPKEQFEDAYRLTDGMTFGLAVEAAKKGFEIARTGWNGKGMYVRLNPARDFGFSELCPFFTIKNVRNSFDTWVPSISDILADDWQIV